MGGKAKQSQRTKNNVRPSSSGRSAELLGSPAHGAPLGIASPGFPTLAAATAIDAELTPEFSLCFKKLNKKDPITRAKALQELTELVQNSKVDDVVAALPTWTHYYKMLTVDVDRKVREVTQVCHGAIVAASGRRLAPWLRRLLPAWLAAQYDDHAPACARANHTLTTTFPDHKLPEVISFCKAEVMAYFTDNLIGNVDSVINKKTEQSEQREQQYTHAVTGSLHGLECFILLLPEPQLPWLCEQLQPLLAHNAFWKHATHEDVKLRCAWYLCVARMATRLGGWFGERAGAKALRLLLAAKEVAAPAHHRWAALLALMHAHPEWHKWLDKKDLLVKRVLDILENGGWGEARQLTAVLLPVLAHLPPEMLTKQFYETFFNATFVGLEQKSVFSSKSERQAWITSLADCLRYLSIQQNDFAVEVVTGVHRTWLEKIRTIANDAQIRTNLIKHSATCMASLVKYWLKQAKEENSEKYDQLIRNFWQNIGSTLSLQIEKSSNDQNEITKLVEGHVLLIQTLKTSFHQEAKKQLSIKFDGDKCVDTVTETPAETQHCDAASVERYEHNMNDLVETVCVQYFELASAKEVCSAVLTPLMPLVVQFDSATLWTRIACKLGLPGAHALYARVVRPWLSGAVTRCRPAVHLLFLLMAHLTEDEQNEIFDSFQHFPPPVVEWCLSVCVSHPYSERKAVRSWLRGRVVRDAVLALCRRVIHDGDNAAKNLLMMCLAHASDGEMLISQEAVSCIVTSFSQAVCVHGSGEGDAAGAREGAAQAAAALATTLACAQPAPGYTDLVLGLFKFNLLVQRGASAVSGTTWCEVRAAWQDAMAALAQAGRDELLRRMVDAVLQRVDLLTDDLHISEIEHIASLCPYLLSHCDDTQLPSNTDEIVALTKSLLPPQTNLVESFALRYDCVVAKLNCPFDDDNDSIKRVVQESDNVDVTELKKEDLLNYVNRVLFRAIYLRTLLMRETGGEEGRGSEGGEKEEMWCGTLLKDEYIVEQFNAVMYDYSVVCSLQEGYAFWPHYEIIVKTKEKLGTVLDHVIPESPGEARHTILASLSAAAAAKGYYWAYARRYYEIRIQAGVAARVDIDVDKLEEVLTGNGYIHSLQANSHTSKDEEFMYRSKFLVMLRAFYCAHADSDVIDAAFARDALAAAADCDVDVIVNAYYTHNETMLYERDVSDAPWRQVVAVAAVAEYLAALVWHKGWDAPAHHWDFTTISLCSLATTLCKSQHAWGSTKVSLLARSVFKLYSAVQTFISGVKAECLQRQPSEHVGALPAEWADVFEPDLACSLFGLILHVLESSKTPVTSNHVEFISGLMSCVGRLDWHSLASAHKLGQFSLQRITEACCNALIHPASHAYQYLAYNVLLAIAKPLVLEDAEKLSLWIGAEEGEGSGARPEFALKYFQPVLPQLLELLDAALCNVRPGEESCEVAAPSDSLRVALGALLLSVALLHICSLQRSDLALHYAELFRQYEYWELVLKACLRLLPAPVAAHALDPAARAPPPADPRLADYFLNTVELSLQEPAQGGTVAALACRGLYLLAAGAGRNALRAWAGAAPARPARALTRLVGTYVAPHLVRAQLQNVQKHAGDLEDCEITIHWSAGEVCAIYTIEERGLELRVSLPADYPLSLPLIAQPAAGAASPTPSPHWIAAYLAYQNWSVLNAIKMWTSAVSSRVAAAAQCYICYCRLQPGSGRLPTARCRQCRNRFHTACLSKWFATSAKSSCPLCRSEF